MANQKITDVGTISSLNDTDSIFVNDDGSLKQVNVNNMGFTKMKLLWENASPNSSFTGEQTINLDISQYSHIGFICNYATTYPRRYFPMVIIPNIVGIQGIAHILNNGRSIEIISSSAVKIGGTSNGSTADAIPCFIYGIKGIL